MSSGNHISNNSAEDARLQVKDELIPVQKLVQEIQNHNQSYWFSGEEDEQLRLTGSHFALKEFYEGNIQPEVMDLVSFEKGISMLHIFSGANALITDMAMEYPKSKFVGVDTTVSETSVLKLPNVTLLQGDVVKGLQFPDNSFDYIQMRIAGSILKEAEWPIALKEVYRLLRPGGCIGFFEYEPRENGSEGCKAVFRAVSTLMKNMEQDSQSGLHLEERLNKAGLEHLKTEISLVNCGEKNGTTKRWLWTWTALLNIMGPLLTPILDVKLEDWPAFTENHKNEMEQSAGYITAIRVAARKPMTD